MGTVYNANAVKDGMVLCLDAGNAKTYPGSGTSFYSANQQAIVGTLNGISVANYTPASGGLQAKAFVFPNAGTVFPSIPDNTAFDFRNNISWDCVACMSNLSNRQSIWAQINTSSPWNGMGLVSFSLDSSGHLAWWGGNYVTDASGNWWDTGLSPTVDKWAYAAGTWSSTTQKAYLWNHGATSMSTATTTARGKFVGTAAANTFRVGDNGSEAGNALQILDGAIAFVRIWSTALTDAQVTQNFNSIRGRFGL